MNDNDFVTLIDWTHLEPAKPEFDEQEDCELVAVQPRQKPMSIEPVQTVGMGQCG